MGQGLVRERGSVWRHDDVPGHRRAHDEGADSAGALDDEDQGDRAPGAQVLGVDRWVDLVVSVDVPADVDLEDGVRREWPNHRAPQVLLSAVSDRGSAQSMAKVLRCELQSPCGSNRT